MDQLSQYSTGLMQNPSAGLAPIKNAAIDNINRTYMDVPQSVAAQLSRRGMGSSGANGDAQYRVALARGGDISNLEGQFAQSAINQQNFGASLGQSLLNFGRGSTSTGTGPNTAAANGFASAGGALSNLSTLLSFNNYLKNNGGGGGAYDGAAAGGIGDGATGSGGTAF